MRTLSVERTYSLGQFQNIKLFDSVSIPDGKEFDEDLLNAIRELQLLKLELDFIKYNQLYDNIAPMKTTEKFGFLQTELSNTTDEVKEILEGE